MTGWTYVATRWDGTVLDEIPCSSFSFRRPLKGVGTWTAEAPLSPKLQQIVANDYNPVNATTLDPGRTQIWAFDPGGTPRFCGLLWNTSASITGDDNGVVTLSGTDPIGYYQRRLLEGELDYSVSAVKPGALVSVAIFLTGVGHGWDLAGHATIIDATSGDDMNPLLLVEEFHTILDVVNLAADRANGFEWIMQYGGDLQSGLTMDFLFQTAVGRPLSLVLDSGRNIVCNSYVCDATEMANEIWISGEGSGASKTIGTHEDAASHASFPKLQASSGRKTGALPSADLDKEAEALVDARKVCARYASVEIYDVGDGSPVGAYEPGDTVRLILDDGFAQEDDTFRVTDISVGIDENGKETVTAELLSDNVAAELIRRQPDLVRLVRDGRLATKGLENA